MSLSGKTLFITALAGHRLAIALRAARDGANVAVVQDAGHPPPSCRGRSTARRRRSRRPGAGLAVALDIGTTRAWPRRSSRCRALWRIDILGNNASAINLSRPRPPR